MQLTNTSNRILAKKLTAPLSVMEFPAFKRKPKLIHNILRMVHILTKKNPVQNLSFYFFNINVNIIFTSSGLFPSNFPTNTLYTFHFSPIRARFLDYNTLYALMFLIIFGKVYELWHYSSRYFLQSSAFSSLICPKTTFRILFWNNLLLHYFLKSR